MATQHFFIGKQYFGSATRSVIDSGHCIGSPVYGYSFYCPVCDEIWARMPVEGQASSVFHRCCAKHPPGSKHGTWSIGSAGNFPGSIWVYDDAFHRALPEALLQREISLLAPGWLNPPASL